jgi:hypothetical protein
MPQIARLLPALAALALVAAPGLAQQQPPAQKARIACDNVQRGNRMSWIDNPMAPSAINRRLQLAEETLPGIKLELFYNNDNPRESKVLISSTNAAVKATSLDATRFGTGDIAAFAAVDFEDGAIHLITYNFRTQKALWTMQTDKFDGRDRAAFARTLSADCSRPIAILQ